MTNENAAANSALLDCRSPLSGRGPRHLKAFKKGAGPCFGQAASVPEAALKCRSRKKGRYAPPVHMIELTETRGRSRLIRGCIRMRRGEGAPRTKCDTEQARAKQARAKQDKTGNGHSEETVRSEFFTHGTPRLIVRPRLNRTTQIRTVKGISTGYRKSDSH
jgi:hypothetical protein